MDDRETPGAGEDRARLLAEHERWLVRAEAELRAVDAADAALAASPTDVPPSADPAPSVRLQSLLERRLGLLMRCLAERPEIARLCLVEAPASAPAAREIAVSRLRAVLDRETERVGARTQRPVAVRMAAGGIYDTVQRAAHAGDTDALPELAPELARVWAPVLAGA